MFVMWAALQRFQGGSGGPVWILALASWNDSGEWIDSEVWID